MIRIGLTGNIGSGKTTVCRIFSMLGVPVFHADAEAKKMYELPAVKEEVRELLGKRVFHPEGEINKKTLAETIFNDSELLNQLNHIIHPRVRSKFNQWCEQNKNRHYVIQEAAILFESGFSDFFHKIITVAADKDIRIKRIMMRDQSDLDMILKRMAHQMSEEEKISKSDFVIRNNGSELVIPQVLKIHKTINKL